MRRLRQLPEPPVPALRRDSTDTLPGVPLSVALARQSSHIDDDRAHWLARLPYPGSSRESLAAPEPPPSPGAPKSVSAGGGPARKSEATLVQKLLQIKEEFENNHAVLEKMRAAILSAMAAAGINQSSLDRTRAVPFRSRTASFHDALHQLEIQRKETLRLVGWLVGWLVGSAVVEGGEGSTVARRERTVQTNRGANSGAANNVQR